MTDVVKTDNAELREIIETAELKGKKIILRYVGGAYLSLTYLRLAHVSSEQAIFIHNRLKREWKNPKYSLYFEEHLSQYTWYHFQPRLNEGEKHSPTEYAKVLEWIKKEVIKVIIQHPTLSKQLFVVHCS